MSQLTELVSERTGISARQVDATVALLDDGATVPFISRYRKERTGSLDEVAVRAIETELKAVRELLARKEFVRQAIETAGAMTPQLSSRLDSARTATEVEDIYAPFKPRKRTRATAAREKGLEPLARIIMSGRCRSLDGAAGRFAANCGGGTAEALEGASDIIAEWASESTRLRNITRNVYRRTGTVGCAAPKGKEDELRASVYAQYGDYTQRLQRVPSHQYLAIRRAEAEGLLKVKLAPGPDAESLDDALVRAFVPAGASGECRELIEGAVRDSSKRLLRPSVENELASAMKEEADKVATAIFADNLRQLLLAPPLKGRRVLALDPGYRTGCKVVALDEQGNLLADSVIYPVPPKNDTEGAARTLARMVKDYRLEAAAVGNGTASRETEAFVKGTHLIDADRVFTVSESGASVYSASDIARKEFPDKDVTVRGAVSIGRRLIDPLAELVKIDPKSIGVGQYQHDVDQTGLKSALDYTVMSCVNAVGVDVNTASEKLLSYISGIGPSLAANIVNYRAANGRFARRSDLRKVPRLGDRAFELAAGFLRVTDGSEPLDNTGIHPESYKVVGEIARRLGVKAGDLPANGPLLDRIDAAALAADGVGGEETIRDIVAELRKPGRDPRTENAGDGFVPAVGDFSQLAVGMTVPGVVSNITAFGAFVNLGIKENGLIHISQLSRRRVASVGEVLKLGQRVEARVIALDADRKRISLSLL